MSGRLMHATPRTVGRLVEHLLGGRVRGCGVLVVGEERKGAGRKGRGDRRGDAAAGCHREGGFGLREFGQAASRS